MSSATSETGRFANSLGRFLPAMPAATSSVLAEVLRKLREEDTVNAFFQDLETVSFPRKL